MYMIASMGLSVARLLVSKLFSVVRPAADDLSVGQADPRPRRRRAAAGLTDDLTDEALTAGQVHTVTFGLDGATYEIDLSAGHAAALRADLATWVNHARETHPPKATSKTRRPLPGTAVGGGDSTTIREWARANGHTVSDRGRLPTAVRQAYRAAH